MTQSIRELIANDAYAITFQTMARYRTALLAACEPDDNDPTTKAQYRRMFGAACSDLGLINEKLGLDPNDGGAEPILDAIDELRSAGETVPHTTLDRWLELLIGLSNPDGAEDVIREIRAIVAAPAPSASPEAHPDDVAVAPSAAQDGQRIAQLPLVVLDALRFYANGGHFSLADDTAWDTVSGEPQNFWCDEAGTATVEDGSIAKAVLQGKAFEFEEPEPAIEGEAFIAAPAATRDDREGA